MAKTLDQVIVASTKVGAVTPVSDVNPTTLPFWIVVVNPRRQPPKPKYYFGYATEREANTKCSELNEQAKRDAASGHLQRRQDKINRKEDPETVVLLEPFVYYVIRRPKGGTL